MVIIGVAVGFDVAEEARAAPDIVAGDGAGGVGFSEGAFEAVGVVDGEVVGDRIKDAADSCA